MAGANTTPAKVQRNFRGSPVVAEGYVICDFNTMGAAETNTCTIHDPEVQAGMAVYTQIEYAADVGFVVTKAIATQGHIVISVKNTDGNTADAGNTKIHYFVR